MTDGVLLIEVDFFDMMVLNTVLSLWFSMEMLPLLK